MQSLVALEPSWGGDIPTRMAAQAEAYRLSKLPPAATAATKIDAEVPSTSPAVAQATDQATNVQESLAVPGPQGNTVAEDGSTERTTE